MRNPRLPVSWYTPKGAIIGAALALGGLWLVAEAGGKEAVVLAAPFIAVPAAVAIIVFLELIFGRGQRAYRFGTGRQEVWGYQGHSVRGIVEKGRIWVSLTDCESASLLNLSAGLKAIPMSRRRADDVKGLMLDMPSMIKVLDACGEDFSRLNRLRLFLERTVWQVRRG